MQENDIKILKTSRGPVEYLDAGSGEAVLALHGAMGGYDQSYLLAQTIGPSDYRYICLSRPGYLGTPLSAGKTPEEQADLYAEVLDLLEIKKVIVMAISGGGPSAIHFALRHSDRCRGLILASTVGGKTDNKLPFAFKLMTFMSRWPKIVKKMKQKTEMNLDKSLARSISDPAILERTLKDAEVMTLFRELTVGSFERMHERIPGTKNDIKTTNTRTYPLKDIKVPTLVIHGTHDPHVPFEQHGKRLAEEIPGAKLVLAEGGEHVTIFTHRKQVQEAVAKFLAEVKS
jgi:pimeloyl-ACP methyl ester carboxylesterase